MPLTKARKVTENLVKIGEAVAMVSVVGVFFAMFMSRLWLNEARPVVHFGDPESIYADAARAGDTTTVHLPIAVARKCNPIPDEAFQMAAQGGNRLTERLAVGLPDLGEVGVTQPSFRFETAVPVGLEPGTAHLSWRALYDCGLRKVEVITPAIPIEVLP